MDTFTITLLTACGASLTGTIVALWKWGTSKDDKILSFLEDKIKSGLEAKTRDETTQQLLVAMKGMIEAIFAEIKTLRKGV